jgi:hypothetical protein
LHTDGRWTFELSTMASASSRSADASTYTWQLPTPVSITGTVDSSTTDLIKDAPPRGISTSTRPRARISSFTESRDDASSSWIASAGNPADPTAERSTSTIAALDRAAEDEPRSRTALPDFRQMPAASAVTLGRAS